MQGSIFGQHLRQVVLGQLKQRNVHSISNGLYSTGRWSLLRCPLVIAWNRCRCVVLRRDMSHVHSGEGNARIGGMECRIIYHDS